MAGMHRDKCGAAFVAGFFKMLSMYRPKGLKVVGAMAVVRNSIGSESYVSDELLTSRAGVRVRIGNTDAEGRMVMCDVLCQMKEKAVNEVNPKLFTIATLTGHVIRAFGDSYTGILDNGPAKKEGVSLKLQQAGDESGDPFEISTLRREDYEFHLGKSEYEDVVQSGGKPSTLTDRGHQSPAAFLVVASGLDKHGCDSAQPVKYSHVDIAGSSGPYPGLPTGSPIVAMAHAFVLDRQSAAK
jgi:leucyl aminopeptidase